MFFLNVMNDGFTITAPIGIETDVASVLGVDSTDLGYLCSNEHGNINVYSKYKPIIHSSMGELTESQIKSCNFGYRIPTEMTLQSLVSVLMTGEQPDDWLLPQDINRNVKSLNKGWWWEPPAGDTNAPFRLTDFNGYCHDTPSYITQLTLNTTVIDGTELFSVGLATQDNMKLSDFSAFSGMHLGIVAYNNVVASSPLFTSDTNGTEISITSANVTKFFPAYGQYRIWAFATETQAQSYDYYGSNYYGNYKEIKVIPLPCNDVFVLRKDPDVEYYFLLSFNSLGVYVDNNTYYISAYLKVQNIYMNSQYFYPNRVMIEYKLYNDSTTSPYNGTYIPQDTSAINVPVNTNTTYYVYFSTSIRTVMLSTPFYVEVTLRYQNSIGEYIIQDTRTIQYVKDPSPII